jgi:hypothetical protein
LRQPVESLGIVNDQPFAVSARSHPVGSPVVPNADGVSGDAVTSAVPST